MCLAAECRGNLGQPLDPTPYHNRNYRLRPSSSLIGRRPQLLPITFSDNGHVSCGFDADPHAPPPPCPPLRRGGERNLEPVPFFIRLPGGRTCRFDRAAL